MVGEQDWSLKTIVKTTKIKSKLILSRETCSPCPKCTIQKIPEKHKHCKTNSALNLFILVIRSGTRNAVGAVLDSDRLDLT